ncbi:MAG: hypothetical protein GY913_24390 [Proteobacteria bacterium]|nr:hypothetical protein [Pseudomonadota bacterium]MCP4920054.1 hypothetical protein [Pseudomonadota bacterium]
MTSKDGDFERLFRGSARLGLLCGALGVPWEELSHFVAAFPGELNDYQELSVDGDAMGLMTRGGGPEFAHRVAHFMELRGVPEERLRRFLATARFFEHKNLFFKVEADASGITECSWYLRRRPDVGAAKAWLLNDGVGGKDLRIVDQVADALGKKTVHFLGGSEPKTGQPGSKVYFSQPDTTESWSRLRAAAGLLGVDWDATVEPHMPLLVDHTAFLSVGFVAGLRVPGCKLDVHDVDLRACRSLLEAMGRWDADKDRYRTLLELAESGERDPRVDYLGITLQGDRVSRLRLYASLGG